MKYIFIIFIGLLLSSSSNAKDKFDPTKPYKLVPVTPTFEGQKCKYDKRLMAVIFDNCFVDKLDGASKYQIDSIENICKRIACNPSMWEKFKYK